MGEIFDTKGYFAEVPGLVLCLSCGHTHVGMIPGNAKTGSLECSNCLNCDSVFISGEAIKTLLKLMEK